MALPSRRRSKSRDARTDIKQLQKSSAAGKADDDRRGYSQKLHSSKEVVSSNGGTDTESGSTMSGDGQSFPQRPSRPPVVERYETLEGRQVAELQYINEHDSVDSDAWYLVDGQWLQLWKAFVRKGERLPGPISNGRLIDSSTGLPKPNLKAVDDYRGVNEKIWHFWHEHYGGGPAVRRKEINLYTSPLPEAEPVGGDRGGPTLPGAPPGSAGNRSRLSLTRRSAAASPSAALPTPAHEPSQVDSVMEHMREQCLEQMAPGKLCCDKCDGPHETDRCSHFKMPEKRQGAWFGYGKKKSTADPDGEGAPIVRHGTVVRQPGDGSCLFHSLAHGLADKSTATTLRKEICSYIAKHPKMVIADTLISEWIRWDSNETVSEYARRMADGHWGGGIEMAALTHIRKVNVHVYEKSSEGYKRISAFESPKARKTVSVLYQGRMHYDALVV